MLTVKALRVLRSADVVLYDALTAPAILALVPSTTKLVNVGKRCGTKAIAQEEINRLIVDYAKRGNRRTPEEWSPPDLWPCGGGNGSAAPGKDCEKPLSLPCQKTKAFTDE